MTSWMNSGIEKLRSVRAAVLCSWISVGLALALTVVQLNVHAGTAFRVFYAVTGIFTAVLLTVLAVLLTTGRGWARWLFLAIYLYGVFEFVKAIPYMASLSSLISSLISPLDLGSGVAQLVLQTTALVLTFTTTARRWYKENSLAPAP